MNELTIVNLSVFGALEYPNSVFANFVPIYDVLTISGFVPCATIIAPTLFDTARTTSTYLFICSMSIENGQYKALYEMQFKKQVVSQNT